MVGRPPRQASGSLVPALVTLLALPVLAVLPGLTAGPVAVPGSRGLVLELGAPASAAAAKVRMAARTGWGGPGPIAIAVDSRGTSYAGFRTGGELVRINAAGTVVGRVPLDRDAPVSGLSVTPGGDIWVDYGTSASLLDPRGRVLQSFEHHAGPCPDSARPREHGGIAATGEQVYVASRCEGTLKVYTRDGQRLAVVDLPGAGRPRGVAVVRGARGQAPLVVVGMPESGRLVAYRAAGLRSSSRPVRVVRLRTPYGGVRPQPSGLAADRRGQLVVSDVANNAVYFLDTTHGFSHYRTLGYPPRAGHRAGALARPAAIAQHRQDGSGLSGNLFIADTRNDRVQRWDTYGSTYWATRVRVAGGSGGSGGSGGGSGGGGGGGGGGGTDPPGVDPPVNTTPPFVLGDPYPGSTLTCMPGSWQGKPQLSYAWTSGPSRLGSGPTYRVTDDDVGRGIVCAVTGRNAGGSAVAVSSPVTILAG